MSYTKTTWANGDTITAEKLNNAESGIEEINMSYEKQTWSNGDTITAEKLNYMENGISGGGGDFTTATLTIISDGRKVDAALPMPVEAGTWDPEQPAFLWTFPQELGNGTYTIVLFKGALHVPMTIEGTEWTTEGNITEMGEGEFLITGDCTIEFK